MKIFSDFFIFIFPPSHTQQICRYYPFICRTIAQITFYIQLVVRSNFNLLQRKYECFVCYKKWCSCVPVWVENKKLETFSRKYLVVW